MSNKHLTQWRHNRAFISTIDPEYPDWAVTVAFYAALHAVDALFKHDKVQGITAHEHRNETLRATNRYRKIWECYRPLYDMSRTVRYVADPAQWVEWDQVEAQVLRRRLYPLEKSVCGLMRLDVQEPIELKPA